MGLGTTSPQPAASPQRARLRVRAVPGCPSARQSHSASGKRAPSHCTALCCGGVTGLRWNRSTNPPTPARFMAAARATRCSGSAFGQRSAVRGWAGASGACRSGRSALAGVCQAISRELATASRISRGVTRRAAPAVAAVNAASITGPGMWAWSCRAQANSQA